MINCKRNISLVLLFWTFVLVIVPSARCEAELLEYAFEVGDSLTDVVIYSLDGIVYAMHELLNDEPLLILYIRSTCSDCRAQFDNYHDLIKEPPQGYSILFLWDGEVPQDDLEFISSSNEMNYSNNKEYKLANWVPTYFVVDTDGSLMFTTIHFLELSEYLLLGEM